MEKVSIIVPIYGVELYIEKCVRSIMSQNYENIEIILVDDGSKDNSGEIIDRLAKEDQRIKVIHKANAGVSAARNSGLAVATGKYILFVDGDDYIDTTYTEYFVRLIVENNADMVFSYNWYRDSDFSSRHIDKKDEVIAISGECAMEEMYLNKIGVAVWNKIYKKELLDEYAIKFNEEFWFAEGMTFNIEIFQRARKIVAARCQLYHQVYNPESAVRKFNLKSWECGRKAMRYQKETWIIHNSKIENAWRYHYREYNKSIILGIIGSNEQNEYRDVLNECICQMHKNIWYPLVVNIPIKDKISSILFSLFPTYMAQRRIKLK